MANLKGVVVVVGTVVAAVGVYYGLEKAMPKKEAAPIVNQTASADEVFGKAIDESAPPPQPSAPPPTAAPASEMAKTAETAPPPADTNQPAATLPPAEEQKPTETAAATPPPQPEAKPEPASETKPENTTASAAQPSSSQLMVPEPALTPEPKPAAPAPQPKPAPAPKPEPPKAEPAKAEPPAPKPAPPTQTAAAPKPTPAPKPAPTPAPAAKPATMTASASPKATPDAPARWWGDPKEQDPRKLNLSYAGQAAGGKGIALLFTGTFVSAGVANWIKVTDANGKAAAGHWELGSSPKMLVFKGMTPGKYTVTIASDLKDAQGKILGRKLSGPVTVQ